MTSRQGTGRDVLAVINLKGGTGKTTTAVFLAHALHEQGRHVALVDADPQGSAHQWNETAPEPFPFPVFGMATRNLHQQLHDALNPEIDAVIIDTPPLDKGSGIVLSAIRVASVVVVPLAPTSIEYDRLSPVAEMVADAAPLRPDGQPVPMAVLLTRTNPTAAATAVYRERIEADGHWCLGPDVRQLQRFAQAYGDNVTDARGTAYGEAVAELMTRRKVAA